MRLCFFVTEILRSLDQVTLLAAVEGNTLFYNALLPIFKLMFFSHDIVPFSVDL